MYEFVLQHLRSLYKQATPEQKKELELAAKILKQNDPHVVKIQPKITEIQEKLMSWSNPKPPQTQKERDLELQQNALEVFSN